MGKKRYKKLDGIRGIALLNMIAYHAVWDMVYLYHFQWEWYKSVWGFVWQQGICWTFIFLSGFCLPLGRYPFKRGVTVFLGGAVITAVTLVLMPQNRVIFGVLTLTGSCMLIFAVFDRWYGKRLSKYTAALGLAVSAALFGITRNVNAGYLGFGNLQIAKLPEGLYANLFTTYLGFAEHDFYSTDYFSLFPWLFLFSAGYFLFRCLEGSRFMECIREGKAASIEWIGRHSLVIYMLHQPVLYLVLELLFRVLK